MCVKARAKQHKMPAVTNFVAAAAVSEEKSDVSLLAAQRLANIVVTTKRELMFSSHALSFSVPHFLVAY